MNINQAFLEAYRNFESVLRTADMTPRDYEDKMTDPEKAAKLRLCRTIRNYLAHENVSFTDASENMVDFIVKETAQLDEAETPVKKKMFKMTDSIHEDDLISSAVTIMLKKKLTMVPVFNESNYCTGVFSFTDLANMIANGNYTKSKKVSMAMSPVRFTMLSETTPMSQVLNYVNDKKYGVYMITNTKTKKIIGWVTKEQLGL